MATIINSISMCNFFNYAGDYDKNIYEFNPGLNVVVADNGAGKSKLFSAFCWILLDKVIDSDAVKEKSVPVENFMDRMLSAKAKYETMLNNEVLCGVRINFSDGDFEYEVEKSFWATKLIEEDTDNLGDWSFEINDIKVTKKNLILLDYVPVGNDLDEKKNIIKKIIKPEFLQYALLQGEEVDNILDFEKRDSLASAVNTLTDTSKIERLIDAAKKQAESAEKDFTAHLKASTSEGAKMNALVNERDDLRKKLIRASADLSLCRERLTTAKINRDNLANVLSGATVREKIRAKQEMIRKDLQSIDSRHSEFLNNLNDKFFDKENSWLLYNTGHYESTFHVIRDNYVNHQHTKQLIKKRENETNKLASRLPDGSPDSFSLRRMLQEETCYVCGRPACKDSTEWHHINSVLALHSPKKNLEEHQNFSKLFDTLMQSTSSFYNQIESIDESLKRARLKDRDFRIKKKELVQALDDASNELIGLGGTKGEEDKFTLNRYEEAVRQILKQENSLAGIEEAILNTKKELEQKESEINKISGATTKPGFAKRNEIMSDVLEVCYAAKKALYLEIVKLLENKSNEFFRKLTETGPMSGDVIRISQNSDESFSVEIRDSDNILNYGLSEGYQRMKKLAVIMAIIDASERKTMEYPLIADAPLSSFGKGFMQAFFRVVPGAFEQTIIMVKDLYDDTENDYLNELGQQVLTNIRSTKGSFHINLISGGKDRKFKETVIKRY